MAADNVIWWPYPSPLPVPVGRVLDAAHDCEAVLVLGREASGDLYVAASLTDKATLLYWVAQFQQKLLAGDYDG